MYAAPTGPGDIDLAQMAGLFPTKNSAALADADPAKVTEADTVGERRPAKGSDASSLADR
jgi:hypothetical protein